MVDSTVGEGWKSDDFYFHDYLRTREWDGDEHDFIPSRRWSNPKGPHDHGESKADSGADREKWKRDHHMELYSRAWWARDHRYNASTEERDEWKRRGHEVRLSEDWKTRNHAFEKSRKEVEATKPK